MRWSPVAITTTLLLSAAVASAADATNARATLAKRMQVANFNEIALTDVVDYFRDSSGLNIVVDWKELELVGIGKDTTVSMKLRNIPTRVALKNALDAAAPGLLTYYISENVITITTQTKADSVMIIRTYPVQDLLVEIPDFEAPSLSLSDNQGGQSGRANRGRNSGGGSGGGLFDNSNGKSERDEEKSKSKAERAQQLIDLVQTTVRPDIWDVNGGKATIKFFNGNLIITAPRSVQEAIGGPVE
jgi:hypothetical protein